MNSEIDDILKEVIQRLAQERNISLPHLGDDTEIVDELGFSSLTVAALIANLEEVLGVDPFQDEDVMITDIRTIKDLRETYERCLEASV